MKAVILIFLSFSILSTFYSIFYEAFSEFLSIVDGNLTAIMNYTAMEIVYLEDTWGGSFHGIWSPAIFVASLCASMVAIYVIFDFAGTGHVVEEAI
jgi:hypothetical protein